MHSDKICLKSHDKTVPHDADSEKVFTLSGCPVGC